MAVNRNNLKQTPIPVVPRTMKIVNPDGTVTRSGQLLLEQLQTAISGTDTGGTPGEPGGPSAGTQVYWRTIDINDTTIGTNIAPNLSVQETGTGIKITGILRKAITANLTVVVNHGTTVLGTLNIPSSTPIKHEVTMPITTKTLVLGTPITFDITNSDGSKDTDGIATVTVEWGKVATVGTITGAWKGPWSSGGTYVKGDTVEYNGSSYISLVDSNAGNQPDTSPTDWDLVAAAGAPGPTGPTGPGVPTGGTAGQVLTKNSSTAYDDAWKLPAIAAQQNGTAIGSEPVFNFIAAGGITVSVTNDATNNRINVVIGGGSGGGGTTSSAVYPSWSLVGWGIGS